MIEPVRIDFGEDGSFDVNRVGGYCYIGLTADHEEVATGIEPTAENQAKVYQLCRAILDAAGLGDVRMVQEKQGQAHAVVRAKKG